MRKRRLTRWPITFPGVTNKERILDISKRLGLSHIGSSLTALPIIEDIYRLKKPEEKFILSAGHSHLAHLIVMNPDEAESLIRQYGIHCTVEAGCDASTGSLGHGLGIAVGMALSDRKKEVFCLISDGECAEGSIWEALRVAWEQGLWNLQVYVNANGWASYQAVDRDLLFKRLTIFWPSINFRYTEQEEPFTGLNGHYGKIT